MEPSRRTSRIAAVVFCCFVCTAVLPAAAGAQQAPTSAGDSSGQPVSRCLTGGGHAFTIGTDDGAHIWMGLHAATVTDSGRSVGIELVGSTADASIVEIVVGFEYVGDGSLDVLTNPLDAFDLAHGFGFQLPIFENTPGFDSGSSDTADNRSAEPNRSTADGDKTSAADDSPFEMLRC